MSGAADPSADMTVERYYRCIEEGLIAPDDRCELLEGVLVSMSPQAPLHAAALRRVDRVLRKALGSEALFSLQSPLVTGSRSVPEPDLAVLAGDERDFVARHPGTALLVVEIADRSPAQDRLTKAAIYARAGVPDYWIVNLRDGVVEWYADPDLAERFYRRTGRASGRERLPLAAFPDAEIEAGDLFPSAV